AYHQNAQAVLPIAESRIWCMPPVLRRLLVVYRSAAVRFLHQLPPVPIAEEPCAAVRVPLLPLPCHAAGSALVAQPVFVARGFLQLLSLAGPVFSFPALFVQLSRHEVIPLVFGVHWPQVRALALPSL